MNVTCRKLQLYCEKENIWLECVCEIYFYRPHVLTLVWVLLCVTDKARTPYQKKKVLIYQKDWRWHLKEDFGEKNTPNLQTNLLFVKCFTRYCEVGKSQKILFCLKLWITKFKPDNRKHESFMRSRIMLQVIGLTPGVDRQYAAVVSCVTQQVTGGLCHSRSTSGNKEVQTDEAMRI